MIHFRSFHMSKCVCIESSSNAYNGSLMLFHDMVEEDEKRKDFGGAFIVYAWTRGARCDIFQVLFDLFVEDKTCMCY